MFNKHTNKKFILAVRISIEMDNIVGYLTFPEGRVFDVLLWVDIRPPRFF